VFKNKCEGNKYKQFTVFKNKSAVDVHVDEEEVEDELSMSWRPQKEVAAPKSKAGKTATGATASVAAKEGAAPDSSAQSKSGGRKGRRGGKKRKEPQHKVQIKDRGLKEMIKVLAKVALQGAQNGRMAMGCVVDSIILDADDPVALAVAEEGEAYSVMTKHLHKELEDTATGTPEREKALKDLRGAAAPCKGNLMAVLETLRDSPGAGKANCAAIGKYLNDLQDRLPDVAVCKIKGIRDDSKVMILLNLRWLGIRDEVLSACTQLGYQVKCDVAPATAAEDELSSYLDSIAS